MTIANQDYAVSFVVEQTPAQAFSAIIDARSWWSSTIEGQLDRAGETINYSYGDMHRCRMEVTDVVPNEAVIWHVVENYFSFADSAAEWVGTDLVFNIVPTSKGTEVTFTHVGLVPAAK